MTCSQWQPCIPCVKFQEELIHPKTPEIGHICCPQKSIANTIAEIYKIQCYEIAQTHLDNIKFLTETCGKYTNTRTTGESAPRLEICTNQYHHVKHILTDLAQIGFYDAETEKSWKARVCCSLHGWVLCI